MPRNGAGQLGSRAHVTVKAVPRPLCSAFLFFLQTGTARCWQVSYGAAPGPAPRLGSAGEECAGWAPSPPAHLSPPFVGAQLLRQLPHPLLLPQPEPTKPGCSSKTNASLGCEPFHYLNTAVGLPSSWPYHLSSALLLPPLHPNPGLVSCCLSFPLPPPCSQALLFAS